MIDTATRFLVLWIAVMGLMPVNGFSAEALPPRALARVGSHRFYHGPGIVCAALSPDGRRAASAANYPETDFVDEKERDVYDRTIVLWDAATGERLREMHVPQGMVSQLAFSPDGKQLAASYGISNEEPSVALFDVETGELLGQFSEFDIEISRLLISAGGKHLMADGDDKLAVSEAATGMELGTIKVPGMLRFSQAPDGRYAVIEEVVDGRDHTRLRLWDIQAGKPLRELLSTFEKVKCALGKTSLVFSTNGKMLLTVTNSTLRLFDAATGEERIAPGHRTPVTPRFSDDGQTLVTACDQKRCRWDVSRKDPILLRQESRKAWEMESCWGYSADGQLFLDCTSDDHFRVRETATGRIVHTLPDRAHIAEFSPDATWVLSRCLKSQTCVDFYLYEAQTGKKSGEFQEVECCGGPVFSPNGRLLAWADRTGVVHLHDAASGESIRVLCPSWTLAKSDKIEPGFRLLFSPDGEQLIVAGQFIERSEDEYEERIQLPLRVFHVSSGREIVEFYVNPKKRRHVAHLSCMACSPDVRLLAVAEEYSGVIRVLEIASGLVRAEFVGHRHGVHGLAFSPDGRTLASGGEDNVVFLWDVTGAKTLSTITDKLAPLWDDLASEDGQRAGNAIASLLHRSETSVAFLCEKLRPEQATSEKRLAQLIADLNSDAYIKREAASRELTLLGQRAEAALRHRLTNRPTLEMRRRIEDLLDKLEPQAPPLETLRALRAIEVLEHIGTPAARHCLEALAKGAEDARQTRAAKTALQRLAKRR